MLIEVGHISCYFSYEPQVDLPLVCRIPLTWKTKNSKSITLLGMAVVRPQPGAVVRSQPGPGRGLIHLNSPISHNLVLDTGRMFESPGP